MAKRSKPGTSRRASADRASQAKVPRTRRANAKPAKPLASTSTNEQAAAGPSAEAVDAFDAAVHAMQTHEYLAAEKAFGTIVAAFPSERALLERARVYRELCQRELDKTAPPRTLEECLTAATAALNDDDEPKAEDLARGVLAAEPRNDIALYLLAAVEARRGRSEAALALLTRAVEIAPEAGARARLDEDFDSLKAHAAFQHLTEPPEVHSSTDLRRTGRKRL